MKLNKILIKIQYLNDTSDWSKIHLFFDRTFVLKFSIVIEILNGLEEHFLKKKTEKRELYRTVESPA